jgi:hypothetical protein
VLEAGLHPPVMGSQFASSAPSAERPAVRADRADPLDELGEVVCERDRFADVLVCGHRARQPGQHRPRKRVARPRFTQPDGPGRGKPRAAQKFASCLGLGLEPVPRRCHLTRLEGEPGQELFADAKQRIDRPLRSDSPDAKRRPLGKLLIHQAAHHRDRDRQLVRMHVHSQSIADADL